MYCDIIFSYFTVKIILFTAINNYMLHKAVKYGLIWGVQRLF